MPLLNTIPYATAYPTAKQISEAVNSMDNPCYKYNDTSKIEYLLDRYYQIFQMIENEGYKKILDFGCGIGASQIVYDMFDWKFDLTLCDLAWSWHLDERDTFEKIREMYGVEYLRVNDLYEDDFTFLDEPKHKFDAVLTFRFPPVSTMEITPQQFKAKLAPWCTDDWDYVYYNISPKYASDNWINEHHMHVWHQDNTHKREHIGGLNAFRIY